MRWLKRVLVRVWRILVTFFGPIVRFVGRTVMAVVRALAAAVGFVLRAIRNVFLPDTTGRRPPLPKGWSVTPMLVVLMLAATTRGPLGPWLRERGTAVSVVVPLIACAAVAVGFLWALDREERPGVQQTARSLGKRNGIGIWEKAGFLLALVGLAWLWRGPDRWSALLVFLSGLSLTLPAGERDLEAPRPAPAVPLEPTDPGDPDTFVMRRFHWLVLVGGDEQAVTLELPLSRLRLQEATDGHPGVPLTPTGERDLLELERWVVEGAVPEVDAVARRIRTLELTPIEEAGAALAFAQSITYVGDPDSTGRPEHWRWPIETLHDQQGDCEDTAILAASILHRLGHGVVLLATDTHLALGVDVPAGIPGDYLLHNGRRFAYAETTETGWHLGEVPDAVATSQLRVIPVTQQQPA